MIHMNIRKPFPEFKWRWASFTPSEGLNDPRVYFGVLRAMRANEGQAPNSLHFLSSLAKVESDLSNFLPTRIDLVRENKRNLLRNSQQYWSSLGLLRATNPEISLTTFGKKVADGNITGKDFAATIIRTLCLPNVNIESDRVIADWTSANIRIEPLRLILTIILGLANGNYNDSFLTNEELVRVIIPLSSMNVQLQDYIDSILAFRSNPRIFDSYEDFAPEANDKRMSREFLLFLAHHGFLNESVGQNFTQHFYADMVSLETIRNIIGVTITKIAPEDISTEIYNSSDISPTFRDRRLVSITTRPGQSRFRADVLRRSHQCCLITGETLKVVLRACHIIPVEQNGSDDVSNGICLREDLHILFDSGHLRIDVNGIIHLSENAKLSPSYSNIPLKINLPTYVNRKCIEHRWDYFS